jgi:malate dehydrogenase (oxaloacetate-decarboxylating)(NADP+)
VHAIAELAQAEQSEVVAAAYAGEQLAFGPEYLIPKPFDPRLMMKIAPAVAQAAADSGVACARSPTWTPTARSCRALCTRRAPP